MFLSPELAQRALERGVEDPHFWYAVDQYLGKPVFGVYEFVTAEQVAAEFDAIEEKIKERRREQA